MPTGRKTPTETKRNTVGWIAAPVSFPLVCNCRMDSFSYVLLIVTVEVQADLPTYTVYIILYVGDFLDICYEIRICIN